MIDFVDPATVPGLTTATLGEGHTPGSAYVHIVYPQLAGAPALDQALRDDARQRLRVFREHADATARGPRPELNVDWQVTAASSQAVGVRLRAGEFLGAGWTNSTRTLWYDRRTGTATGSGGLLGGKDALRRLTAIVKEQLKQRRPQVETAALSEDGEQFDSMAFNRAGDLVVEFDDCQVGPCSLGRVAVAVPSATAEPLLSDLGRRAREGVVTAARRAPQAAPHGTPAATSPPAVSRRAGSVNCAATPCVALTFDDGPGPYTGRLLDMLRQAGARATFFVVGANASAQPGLLRRMSAEGHLVANHSWSHRDLTKQSTSRIADSLDRTEEVVAAAIGQRPTLVRPPYGAVDDDLRSVARKAGLSLVTWNVDADDRPGDTARAIADRAVEQARAGAIILLHDVRPEAVDAVPDVIRRLRAQGYTFVTVPELYGQVGMRPGRLYASG
ncbi:polysaccharide deacetylase family protein [Nonomuraea pusilla]|uniref:polysaccharide deacetylase family protein n=1 Tax=Nonomuraea pusilla TaxID=46177 RepID=UPI00331F1F9F